jgi:hypothetical protein
MNKKTPIEKPQAALNGAAKEAAVEKEKEADEAAVLECRKKCVYKMMGNNSQLKDIIAKVREQIIAEAENSLLKNIQKGNVTSIIFALKTLGRSRGYVVNGYKPNELAAKINQAVLKRLTDEQLEELESLLKEKKNLTKFITEIGLDAPSD